MRPAAHWARAHINGRRRVRVRGASRIAPPPPSAKANIGQAEATAPPAEGSICSQSGRRPSSQQRSGGERGRGRPASEPARLEQVAGRRWRAKPRFARARGAKNLPLREERAENEQRVGRCKQVEIGRRVGLFPQAAAAAATTRAPAERVGKRAASQTPSRRVCGDSERASVERAVRWSGRTEKRASPENDRSLGPLIGAHRPSSLARSSSKAKRSID